MDTATQLDTDLQPFPPGTDYFAALGLPRRMDVDTAALEATYHDLSRRFHPDRFATAAPRVRIISLENSALVNKAYRTLRDPWERARYLVDLEAGGKTDIASQPPSELFEAILDLQETLMELRMARVEGEGEDELKALVAQSAIPFREAVSGLDTRRDDLFHAWDTAHDADRPAILAQLKELLGERRYLTRVMQDIDGSD